MKIKKVVYGKTFYDGECTAFRVWCENLQQFEREIEKRSVSHIDFICKIDDRVFVSQIFDALSTNPTHVPYVIDKNDPMYDEDIFYNVEDLDEIYLITEG